MSSGCRAPGCCAAPPAPCSPPLRCSPPPAAAARARAAPPPAAARPPGHPVPRAARCAPASSAAARPRLLSPLIGVTPIDQGRIQNLYDPLVLVNSDLTTAPGLALEWNINSDATEYEVKLRPDVVFHNGKSFGADDVIYSIQQMAKPATSYAVPFVSGDRPQGPQEGQRPDGEDPAEGAGRRPGRQLHHYNTWIVQDGETNFKNPVGTGPFMVDTFTPGQQSVFKKNPNYWVSGKPYVDELKIISIDDPTARLNALLSGEIDAMAQLPTAQAKAQPATGDIFVLGGTVARSP